MRLTHYALLVTLSATSAQRIPIEKTRTGVSASAHSETRRKQWDLFKNRKETVRDHFNSEHSYD
jgi:hypothetical protein